MPTPASKGSQVTLGTSFIFPFLVGIGNEDALPALVMEQMAAGAFIALCEHLRVRSDQVRNIDLMTVGGFCRNSLAKVRDSFQNLT